MTRLAGWRRALRARLARRALEREMDDEMRFHLDMEAEDIARTSGVPPDEARRRAAVAFGGVARHKDDARDGWPLRWLEEVVADVRYGVRSLRRSPGFTTAAVLVLALGIGAGTAIFSLLDAALLAPLPFPNDQALVRIYEQNSPSFRWGLSVADVRGIEQWQRTLSAVGVLSPRDVAVATSAGVRRMSVDYATSGFFRALALPTRAGRLFTGADDQVGAPPVALVTHAFAARELGGDTAALGRTITIDGAAHVVVGVLPSNIVFRAELWPVLQLRAPTRRGPFGLYVIARLADGATLASARRDLADVSARLFPQWAESFQDRTAKLTPVPLHEAILGQAPHTLAILGGAVALVLLIAVVNVASLMLVRATGRWREVVLRAALGASRRRLVRLLVTESVVLATAAAALGLGVGALALRAYAHVGPQLPRLAEARMNGRAALVAVGLALVTGIIIGAYPALLLFGRDLARGLRDGDRGVGGDRRTQLMRGAFVVAEFGLALPLLAAAGLLINSLVRLQRVEPGFDPRTLLTVRVALPGARYAADSTAAGFWVRALARVREVPGVVGAAIADALPPDARPGLDENNFDLVDRPVPPGSAQPTSPWVVITPDYFDVLGVKLLQGRAFVSADTASPTDVAAAPTATPLVVSRAWAQHYFPDGSALGRRLVTGGCTTCPPSIIVGVVSDVKYMGLDGTSDAVYEPMPLGNTREAILFVRTSAPPGDVIPGVARALRSVEPGVPLDDVAPMSDRVYASVTQPRHIASLLGAFAIVALALAAVGIFGMLSYTVSTRQREIGVRMALGARPGEVVAMVVRRGMRHAVTGALLGLVLALLTMRWLGGFLFAVSAADPVTLGLTTAGLLIVALVACWVPARRAARIDPVRAVRSE